MKSKASLDATAKVLTSLTIGLTIWSAALAVRAMATGAPASEIIGEASVFLVMAALLIFAWSFAPRYYEITRDDLAVVRPARRISIPLQQISTVDELPPGQLQAAIRTFGVGGLFGYYGKFFSPGLGHFTMHATKSRGMVLIVTTEGKKIVISPDDETFAARLRGALKSLAV